MIKYIDDGYKSDVRHMLKALSSREQTQVPKVMKTLLGIARNRAGQNTDKDRNDIAHALKTWARTPPRTS